jgi:hypothetical protein
MNLAELRGFADAHTTRSAFRLETLDQYLADSDRDNVRRYLGGEDGPSWARGDDWMDYLKKERAAGIHRYRVHVLSSPIGDYLRYECEWGYAYTSAAGEEIYILDLAETTRPDGLPAEVGDFWLYDDSVVVLMHYDENGRFRDAEELPATTTPQFRRYREAALSSGTPFHEWWHKHPEYLRR